MNNLFLLFAGHFLADFPLQGEHIAKTKNWHYVPDYIPEGQTPTPIWFYSLTAHAMIHGLMVYLITGSMELTLLQVLSHWGIDFLKCENIINPHVDQVLHYLALLLLWLSLNGG